MKIFPTGGPPLATTKCVMATAVATGGAAVATGGLPWVVSTGFFQKLKVKNYYKLWERLSVLECLMYQKAWPYDFFFNSKNQKHIRNTKNDHFKTTRLFLELTQGIEKIMSF